MKLFRILFCGLMILFGITLIANQAFALFGRPSAKIKVTVRNESGQPVDKAQLRVRFSSDDWPVETFTDSDGIAIIKSRSDDGVILCDITKEGYYDDGFAHDFFRIKFGRWQPWPNELTVTMRPILNPVPMYVRNTYFVIPEVGKPIGFDLEKSDWVIPYGQGVHADFIFQIERKVTSYTDFNAHMVLTFSNPHDGIQLIKDDGGGIFNTGSQFRLPRMAPLDGYQPKLDKSRSTSSPTFGSHEEDSNNYIFRVRSEVNEEGKLVRAMYGKIRGVIEFEPRRTNTAKIYMHYYLNPDYTRNLEWDPKRNLSHPSDSERIEEP
ncbi:MAG: carboxypeptidase-like regulatory domain-containing protein [Geopsychrobacter sp.]|nr:carboxypeptidase-like regulatory domain-containing protein [Geopsychrobacter sp.]